MALKLILGPSGSGKSRLLFDTVLQSAAKHPERRFIVLVPEQFTLATQRDLVERSAVGGILNIDVLSFTRLAYRVFEQTGLEKRTVLSETGKSLMLRLIASRESESLPFLSGIADRPGAIAEMKSILSEMDQYQITPSVLKELMQGIGQDKGRARLAGKLEEIALLQEAFEKYQADHFITGEKLPYILCQKAPLDATLRGTEFYLDGYTGFTPAQLSVLEVLMRISGDMTVTVTADPGMKELAAEDPVSALSSMQIREHELFALSRRTIRSLTEAASRAGVQVERPVVLDGRLGRLKEGSELAWMEGHLFRSGCRGHERYTGAKEQQIRLRSCRDSYDEVVSAAVTIKELTGAGMRHREIAVVCGSLPDYAQYVKRVFESYGIPYFIDQSSPVTLNPAFEMVESAVDVVEKNYSYESVMRLIRTGLILDPESGEADLLENYLRAAGIRGRSAWEKPFTRPSKREDPALLGAAEIARAEFMQSFRAFSDVMKKENIPFSERADALSGLLEDCHVPEKLAKLGEACALHHREESAAQYAQVMDVIRDVLEEACGLIGSERVTRRQFTEVLRAGFSEARIGVIPPGIDEVHVGDLRRTRLEHIRALLFLGVNDGYVPARKTRGNVLNDMDREYLKSRHVRMAPTAREDANIQQFYLYLTLTKPSDLLILSWSQAGRDAEPMRSAPLIGSIRRLFPDRELMRAASEDPYYAVVSAQTGLEVLSSGLRSWLDGDDDQTDEEERKLRELLKIYKPEDTQEALRESALSILGAAAGDPAPVRISPEEAQELYGEVLKGSVTRLETYAQCPFRQYAAYGLKLRERDEYKVEYPDIGQLLHASMEVFSERMKTNPQGYTWRTIPDALRDAWALEAMEEAAGKNALGLYEDTRRGDNTLQRCRQILLRSVRTVQKQVQSGDFSPALFEVPFSTQEDDSGAFDLPSGARMRLTGRIDRIDECDDPECGKLYVSVVDYKSSQTKLDLDSLIDGEQLQLALYLDMASAMERRAHRGREVVPSGALYYAMEDPILEREDAGEDPEEGMLKSLKLRGFVNDSPDVLQKLDRTLIPGASSMVIPAALKNDGTPTSRSVTYSSDQIGMICSYVKQKMGKMGASILNGEIRPYPLRESARKNACTYCPYADLCHFSEHEDGMQFHDRQVRSEQEQWEILSGAGGSRMKDETAEGEQAEGDSDARK